MFVLFFAGLALFFAGLRLLVRGLSPLSSTRAGHWLAVASSAPWRATVTGALATALVQSSSVVTALVVGLVESGACQLSQGIYITVGANVGSTLLPQVIATRMPPIEALLFIVAAAFWMARRPGRCRPVLGAALVLTALRLMVLGAAPLARTAVFQAAVVQATRTPLLALAFGLFGAAALQSSSLVIATVLALARTGSISAIPAVAVVLGSNIGTCVTALLAAASVSRPAARSVAMFHLVYNALGVAVLFPLLGPCVSFIAAFSPDLGRQVANAHTLFNLVSIVLAVPLVRIFTAGNGTVRAKEGRGVDRGRAAPKSY